MVNASTKDGDLTLCADNLLLATGGKAAPQYGTTGDGYRFAKSFGHSVSKVFPILAPVECACEDVDLQRLKGIRATGKVTLLKDGAPVLEKAPELGEIQFTADGLSGICVFDRALAARKKGAVLSLDLLPDCADPRDLMRTLAALPFRTAEDFLSGLLPRRIGSALMRGVHEGPMTDPSAALPDRELDAAARTLKDWRFTPAGEPAWSAAQVTHGGVPGSALDRETLEVRDFPGLYIIGEAADADGGCGGYNLHWAWASAHAAARAVIGRVNA